MGDHDMRRDLARHSVTGMAGTIALACLLPGVGCGSGRGASLDGTDGGSSGSSGAIGPGSGGSNGGGASGIDGSIGSSGSGGAGSNGGSGGASSGSSNGGSADASSFDSGWDGATGDDGGACSIGTSNVRVTEVDVGSTVLYNEVDNNGSGVGLTPLAISPMPSGGSRLAWLSSDGMVHIAQLDATDHVVSGSTLGRPAYDFQDLYADDKGGVVLVSRPATGGSAADHNCGNVNNLCGPNLPTADSCMDMYLVRFDGMSETWAAKLTDPTTQIPSYGQSATTGPNVVFIWWYAHNGRIAFDGSNYGAYFGAAITVPNAGCIDPNSMLKMAVNIHQGDRLKIVDSAGNVQNGGFGFGCSHSAFQRILWDGSAKKFMTACENDAPVPPATVGGRLALAPDARSNVISTLDLAYSNFGNILVSPSGGYWAMTSNIRPGQPAAGNGFADVHLLHFTTGKADQDLIVASDSGLNDRAPHLSAYGINRMLAAWETSTQTGDLRENDTNRKLYVQALNATTGAAEGSPFYVPGVRGSRYQDFRPFPDGSVAFPAQGSSNTKIKILRVLPCN